MNKTLGAIATVAALSLLAPVAWADHHMGPGAKPGMAMSDKDKQMNMEKMQENMLRMHEQMHKIQDAKTPKDRERHMKEMQGIMQSMHSMKEAQGGMGGMGDHNMDRMK